MMRLPVIKGLIRRRLLVNFRVDAKVMERFLPRPFQPKLHRGFAIAGICLIRLEEIRPAWLPRGFGLSSENAAHRVAATWESPCGEKGDGVFIPCRQTSSWVNHLAGGKLFPGEHELVAFNVKDDGNRVSITIQSREGEAILSLQAHETDALPETSCFRSLEESSEFFESGSLGYSVTGDCCRFDGIRLQTDGWEVRPLFVDHVQSAFFSNASVFPEGSLSFDHALIMRDRPHQWHRERDLLSSGD